MTRTPCSLTRAALFKLGDYSQAGYVIDEIINSGNYALETNYQNIFDNKTSSSVFEIDCTDAQYASWACMLCSQGNVMAGFQGIKGTLVLTLILVLDLIFLPKRVMIALSLEI